MAFERYIAEGSACDTLVREICYSARCDWAAYVEGCEGLREPFKKCPVFDALAYQSLSQTAGLVYLEQGKGLTVPHEKYPGGPNFDEYQGLGRCVNATCSSGPPPGPDGVFQPGDTWCDSIPNDEGRVVIQIVKVCCSCSIFSISNSYVIGRFDTTRIG